MNLTFILFISAQKNSKKSDFENELKKTIKIKKYKYYQFIKGQNDEEKKKNY